MGNWLFKWKIRGGYLGINKEFYCDWKIVQKLDIFFFMFIEVEDEDESLEVFCV